MYRRAQKSALMACRLSDNREQYPIRWLLEPQGEINPYHSNLDMIKSGILCMDKYHQNFQYLSEEDKEKATKLTEHNDIVDIVLFTLFQWFGTNVGKKDIGELLDEIRKL